jgi:L-ascorbate metabolism protein UlaG (beta-lactamase superfamily)
MAKLFIGVNMFFLVFALTAVAQGFETDTIKTFAGDLKITFIGHGTLMLSYAGKIIHVDPVSQLADYRKLPKADLILVTHEHHDHLDLTALELIRAEKTVLVASESCAGELKDFIIMKNGDIKTMKGFKIEAVPAYNIVHMRSKDVPYHPKDVGNGYVITCGDRRVYIAGDTENIPEMKSLEAIDVAFLPMNLPYTMTPEMVAAAAMSFEPKILYPYHFSDTDTSRIVELLKGTGIEVRIRKMN